MLAALGIPGLANLNLGNLSSDPGELLAQLQDLLPPSLSDLSLSNLTDNPVALVAAASAAASGVLASLGLPTFGLADPDPEHPIANFSFELNLTWFQEHVREDCLREIQTDLKIKFGKPIGIFGAFQMYSRMLDNCEPIASECFDAFSDEECMEVSANAYNQITGLTSLIREVAEAVNTTVESSIMPNLAAARVHHVADPVRDTLFALAGIDVSGLTRVTGCSALDEQIVMQCGRLKQLTAFGLPLSALPTTVIAALVVVGIILVLIPLCCVTCCLVGCFHVIKFWLGCLFCGCKCCGCGCSLWPGCCCRDCCNKTGKAKKQTSPVTPRRIVANSPTTTSVNDLKAKFGSCGASSASAGSTSASAPKALV